MPTVSSATKNRVVGDIVKSEADILYTRVSRTLDNDTSSASTAVTNFIGYPVMLKAGSGSGTSGQGTDYALCQAGSEASCIGLVVGGPEAGIPAMIAWDQTPDEYAVLVRGPAVVAKDALPTTDSEGAAYDLDAIATALAALAVPIIALDSPSVSSTQTT